MYALQRGAAQDPANEKGGKWTLTLTSKEDINRLDEMWESLLLSMIGEYLDDGSTEAGKDFRAATGLHWEGRSDIHVVFSRSFRGSPQFSSIFCNFP